MLKEVAFRIKSAFVKQTPAVSVAVNPFAPPAPMKSVAPDDVRMAMDSALRDAGIYTACFDAVAGSKLYNPFIGWNACAAWEEDNYLKALVEPLAKATMKRWCNLVPEDGNSTLEINELIDITKRQLARFGVHDHFVWAAHRIYYAGGCKLFIDVGEDELSAPLSWDDVKLHGKLRKFIRVEAYSCYPDVYNASDPLADDYFCPTHWWVGNRRVHKSRFVHFRAEGLSQLLLPKYNLYGMPIIQMAKDEIADFKAVNREVTMILKRMNLDVLATNLSELVSTDCKDPEAAVAMLKARIAALETIRDNFTAIAIDKESEAFTNVTTPLSNLDTIVAQKLELLALCNRLPVIKNFGTPPKGFNATGAEDNRTYEERLAEERTSNFDGPMAQVLQLMQLDATGTVDKNLSFEWNKSQEISETEQTDIDTKKLSALGMAAQNGMITEDEAREELPETMFAHLDKSKEAPGRAEGATPPSQENMLGTEAGSMPAQDDFSESDHPRDKSGQFSSNGSSGAVELSGNELGEYSDIKELRQKAVNYYKENLQGKTIKNPELGDVLLSRKGLGKYRNTSADENKLKMVIVLDKIIAEGKYAGAIELDKPRNDGIVRFHRINKDVNLGSKTYKASVLVGEDRNGHMFYNLNPDSEKYAQDKSPESTCATKSGCQGIEGNRLNENIIPNPQEINIYLSPLGEVVK